MSKVYELWDMATNNLVEACDSEADALAFVRAYIAEHGAEYPTSWALLWDDDAADQAGQIAEGSTLLARAGAASDSPRTPARASQRHSE